MKSLSFLLFRFFACLLPLLPLLAEEEILPEGYILADLFEDMEEDESLESYPQGSVPSLSRSMRPPRQQEPTPQAIALLEADPSAMVAGCVHALSGSFFDADVDLVIPGAEPLVVQHSYSSAQKEWHFQHMPQLEVGQSEGAHHLRAGYQDGTGAGMLYTARRSKSKTHRLDVANQALENGLTNCSSGWISGQTNWKNSAILFSYGYGAKRYVVTQGSAVNRIFSQYKRYGKNKKGAPQGKFRLAQEYHPNGNQLLYKYNDDDLLSSVEALNRQGKSLGKLAVRQTGRTSEWSCNGASVRYFFDMKRKELQSITPSMGKPVSFEYENGYVSRKIYPEGRFIQIEYLKDEGQTKVHRLLEPVGADGAPVTTYTFSYRGNKNIGSTTVTDAAGQVTQYMHSHQRLSNIARYAGSQMHSLESFYWGSGPNEANLQMRTFGSGEQPYFCRQYAYDPFGNVIQNILWGNLTGESLQPLVVDKAGNPQGGEFFIKVSIYSQDKRNLILEEHDGAHSIYYDYDPVTHLLIARLTKSNGCVLKREFFSYDANGVVVEELIDDGSGSDQNDLTGVTERHYKKIIPTATMPIGLPASVEQGYVNQGQYFPLKKETNTYSPEGKLLEQAHYGSDGLLAYTLHWSYNSLGLVTSQTNALGETTRFEYDGNGNKIRETTADSDCFYTYDLANRLIKEEEVWPDGQRFTTVHRYNLLSQRIETIDPLGHSTTYVYDLLGRLIETHLPLTYAADGTWVKTVQRSEYDVMGNVTASWDGNGHCTKTQYTIRGQPCLIEHPDGSIERMSYTVNGWLKKRVEKNGLTEIYWHDPFGRVIRTDVYDAEGNGLKSTSSTYNTFHLLSETGEGGVITCYTYDQAGRCVAKAIEDKVTTYRYDALGRKTHTCQAGRVAVQEYDLLNRLIEERLEDEAGNVFERESYQYDTQGNKTHTTIYTQAGPATTITRYNPNGDPVTVIDPLGHETHYTYNYTWIERGQYVLQITKTDPLGTCTVTIRDAQGRIASEALQNGFGETIQLETHVYDRKGQRLSTLTHYPQPVLTEWEYDAMGNGVRLTEASGSPNQKTTRTVYNVYGQKEKIVTPNGVELVHTYDSLGRLKTLRSSDQTVAYTYSYDIQDRPVAIADEVRQTTNHRKYDVHGRLIEETLDNGLMLGYAYDLLDRPLLLTFPDGTGIRYQYNAAHLQTVERLKNEAVQYTHRYTAYDQAGNVLSEKLLANAGTLDYTYDLLQRKVAVNSTHWQETLAPKDFDAAGNLLRRHVNDPRGFVSYIYAYDSLYQVVQEAGAAAHTYTHDSLYNRTAKDGLLHQNNELNQLLSHGNTHYEYDLNGNLVAQTDGLSRITYRYDALGRLIEVFDGEHVTQYQYDSMHRRVAKRQNGTLTHYLYENQNEIGAVQEDRITQLRVLGVGLGADIGAAVAIELGGKVYAPIHDPYGNVVALVDPQGHCVENCRYTAFGETDTPSALGNPWGYSSKRLDPETGLFYFGKRYYAPNLGRWITPDPAGLADGMNLYAFVHNAPLRYVDPDGRFAFLIAPLLISLAIDLCLPTAAALTEQYAGGAIAAFAVGMVKGYQGDISLGDLNPASMGLHSAGMAIGGLIALKDAPKKAVAGIGSKILSAEAWQAGKSLVTHTVSKVSNALARNTAAKTAQVAERTLVKEGTEVLKKGARNRLTPDVNATGAHTVFRKDPKTSRTTHYETFQPQTNFRNPKPWESIKRFDGNLHHPHTHYNKLTKQDIFTPHIHDPGTPGGIRIPQYWEIP